ncbi:UNVERIFIED_ORG: hypothetical protein M2193_000025 [Bradyrhizobium japonicum]|jgi:hypothetical protein
MGRLQQPGMAWAELKNKLREGMVIWITLGGLSSYGSPFRMYQTHSSLRPN